jgi:hypothetical protein
MDSPGWKDNLRQMGAVAEVGGGLFQMGSHVWKSERMRELSEKLETVIRRDFQCQTELIRTMERMKRQNGILFADIFESLKHHADSFLQRGRSQGDPVLGLARLFMPELSSFSFHGANQPIRDLFELLFDDSKSASQRFRSVAYKASGIALVFEIWHIRTKLDEENFGTTLKELARTLKRQQRVENRQRMLETLRTRLRVVERSGRSEMRQEESRQERSEDEDITYALNSLAISRMRQL